MSKRFLFIMLVLTVLFGGLMFDLSLSSENVQAGNSITVTDKPDADPTPYPVVEMAGQIKREAAYFSTSGSDQLSNASHLAHNREVVPSQAVGSMVFSLGFLAGGLLLAVLLVSFPGTGARAGVLLCGKWGAAMCVLAALVGVRGVVGVPGTTRTIPKPMPAPVKQTGSGAPDFVASLEIGGRGTTQIGGTAVDEAGNVYVTGGFSDHIFFATTPPTKLTATRGYDFFVAKYSPDRKCLWARMANGTSDIPADLSLDGGLTITVDSQGNCYVGGGFVSSLAFQTESGTTAVTLAASGSGLNAEAFVAKYNSDGTLLWARGGNSNSPQSTDSLNTSVNSILKIVVDRQGTPYVTGQLAGNSFLGKQVQISGAQDSILARLNPATGDPVWTAAPVSTGSEDIFDLAVDGVGNLYLVGAFLGQPITFPTPSSPTTFALSDQDTDTYIAKYTPSGQCVFARQIGGGRIVGFDIAATSTGDFYVTGAFISHAVFGDVTLTSNTVSISGFLAKYSTTGSLLFAQDFGKNLYTSGNRVEVDAGGTVYVVGYLRGEAIFGGIGQNAQTLSSSGVSMFLAVYNAAGAFEYARLL
ncbi:MAG TPA: hypothetical protein PKZ53_15775, partial [Acidobacteriota bacterium]|nr:hypothetical protein [Acidobacteriota bacterium]